MRTQTQPTYRNAAELEAELGQTLRQTRLERAWTQAELAGQADISISAVQTLEAGKGSSLTSLVKVVRALDRVDWLTSLAPPIDFSPLLVHDSPTSAGRRRRAPRRRLPLTPSPNP